MRACMRACHCGSACLRASSWLHTTSRRGSSRSTALMQDARMNTHDADGLKRAQGSDTADELFITTCWIGVQARGGELAVDTGRARAPGCGGVLLHARCLHSPQGSVTPSPSRSCHPWRRPPGALAAGCPSPGKARATWRAGRPCWPQCSGARRARPPCRRRLGRARTRHSRPARCSGAGTAARRAQALRSQAWRESAPRACSLRTRAERTVSKGCQCSASRPRPRINSHGSIAAARLLQRWAFQRCAFPNRASVRAGGKHEAASLSCLGRVRSASGTPQRSGWVRAGCGVARRSAAVEASGTSRTLCKTKEKGQRGRNSVRKRGGRPDYTIRFGYFEI
jgi:hypothetical protein